MHRKCPYLSTALECFAGSFGTIRCLHPDFHSRCEFRLAADNKDFRNDINVLDKNSGNNLLDNLIAINF